MSINRNKAFEAEEGFVITDGPGSFATDQAPIDEGNQVLGDKVTDGLGRKWVYRGKWVLDTNVSTHTISTDEVIEIKSSEEMLITKPIINRGLLINRGLIRNPNLKGQDPIPFVQIDQFDYKDININQSVLVPQNQVMHPGRILKNKGILRNLGLVLFTPYVDYSLVDTLPYETIETNETVTIKSRQQLLLKGTLRNKGIIFNRGKIVII